MLIWLLWAACVLLAGSGLTLLLWRTPRSPGPAEPAGDPLTYVRRIAGAMLTAFGLALGLLSALYHSG